MDVLAPALHIVQRMLRKGYAATSPDVAFCGYRLRF
jgi:hypothetical protein